MKTIKTEIDLYKYDELVGEAKEKAFNQHKEFLSCVEHGEEMTGEEVEESIRTNEYWFFFNGEMADCITYTGGHQKEGITELNFYNKVYQI